jgi:predicted Zn finger-like uncharacterized protein
MAIQTQCPSCSRKLRVPDELIGQSVKCPQCGHIFKAQLEGEPAPSQSKQSSEAFDLSEELEREEPLPPRRRRFEDDEEDDRPRRRYFEPHRGGLILTLGILAIVGICTPITGLLAWIMGSQDLAKMRAGTMDRDGESLTNAGKILGIISMAFFAVGLLVCCLYYVFIAAMVGVAANAQ